VSNNNKKEKEPVMYIPHGASGSQKEFEKGDPDFVDERTSVYKPKSKKSFFE